MPSIGRKRSLLTALLVSLLFSCLNRANAEVIKDDTPVLSPPTPLHCWRDDTSKPKAVVLAVHGLTMHGGTYDALARQLVSQDIVVYAPDLRGYGRWLTEKPYKDQGKEAGLDYDKSYEDLSALIKCLKGRHPNVPLYCIGESLGADLVLHAAKDFPEEINGIILSAPAIKRHKFLGPVVWNAGPFMANPNHRVGLVKYFKRFASEDPKIIEEVISDPLVRKQLTAWDFLRTISCMRPALQYARAVPQNMPVLIIQGSKDRMVRSNAVVLLLKELRSTDQTVRWFSNRGHLLLETAQIHQDTVQTVASWLFQHTYESQVLHVQATVSGTIQPSVTVAN